MHDRSTIVDGDQFTAMALENDDLTRALEHALRELVMLKGTAYLDRFLAYRLGPTSFGGPETNYGAPGTASFRKAVENRGQALRDIVERVRKDPQPPRAKAS